MRAAETLDRKVDRLHRYDYWSQTQFRIGQTEAGRVLCRSLILGLGMPSGILKSSARSPRCMKRGENQNKFSSWAPPHSHARNHDLPSHDPDGAAHQDTSRDTVQTIAYLQSLYGRVAFRLENNALAIPELRDALAEAGPF